MSTWTDELKAKAIQMYKDAEPTADNSMEIVKEIADEIDQSPNGVRMILSKADVYIKKTPATKTATSSTSSEGKSPRISKEVAHARLTEAVEAAGGTVDGEIISKLTGKAAIYFAEVIETIIKD
jgi:transposase-like protein